MSIIPKEVAKFEPFYLTDQIDKHFKTGLKAIKTADTKLYMDEWEIWSGAFNRPLWNKIKETDDAQLKYVYAYWWNRNNLLRLYNKSRMGFINRKKKLVNEGEELRGLIKRVPKILEKYNEEKVVKNIDTFLESLGAQNEKVGTYVAPSTAVEKKPNA